jgi:putative membrane protein
MTRPPFRVMSFHNLGTNMTLRYMPALLLCIPFAVWGADASPDASFYKKAAEAGISEVDAGNLAVQKSSDSKVKDFATMMVKDHTAANEKLKAIADGKGITLPTSASVSQMATEAKLKVLTGDTFDKSYLKAQVKGHQEVVALLQKEIASGQDSDAKAFAQSILPTVRSHLKAANALAASAGVSK